MNFNQPYQQHYQPITATFSSASSDPHYKGYEQAVIEHAKLMQVQQAKEQLFGVPAPRKPFVGQWQKKRKIPKEPVDPRKYFCDVCNVTCGGPEAFETHLAGKSHRHKEGLKTGKIRLDLSRPGYHCEVCNATCSAKDAFTAHLNGVKHNRAIKTLQMLGKPVPEYLLEHLPKGDSMQHLPVLKKVVGVPATKFVGGVKLSTTDNDEDMGAGNDEQTASGFPPIGEEFIELVQSGGSGRNRISFYCKICECNIGDPAAKDLHLRGRRHRLSYKRKIDSSISAEEKVLGRPAIQLPQQPTKTNRSILSKLNHGRSSGFQPGPTLPNTTNFDAYDEQFAHIRLEQIRPSFEFLEKVEELVETIERALKKISDVLIESTVDPDARILRGVVRVGPLGENLLLVFDKKVDVVLMCKDVPTKPLLKQIVDQFLEQIEDEDVRSRIVVETLEKDSAFLVRLKDFELSCTVTLTSVVLRNIKETSDADKKDSGEAEEPPKAVVKPENALPEEPCLHALASLRHTKFFQAQVEQIENLLEVVQIMRDVVRRIDTWSVLNLYILELLVYKALSSCPAQLRVSDGVRRVFEMLACGAFMSASSKLLDPCEKEPVNALVEMTPQQRENLVCSAQHGLRLIAFDQIHTILGMSRDSLNRKRAASDETNEEEAKKPKPTIVQGPPASTPVFPPPMPAQ